MSQDKSKQPKIAKSEKPARSKKEKETEAGLFGQVLKAAGQTGATLGNVAGQSGAAVGNAIGQTGATLGNVADATSRLTRLDKLIGVLPNPFAAKIRSGEVPDRSANELTEAFVGWLRRKNKGQVEVETGGVGGVSMITLRAAGLFGGRYLFIFGSTVLEAIMTARLPSQPKYDGGAVLTLEWPPTCFSLSEELVAFVWQDGVRVGKDSPAADYLADWLKDYTGYEFEKKDLIETVAANKTSHIHSFIGRDEAIKVLERSIVSEWEAKDNLPWIFRSGERAGLARVTSCSTCSNSTAHASSTPRLTTRTRKKPKKT